MLITWSGDNQLSVLGILFSKKTIGRSLFSGKLPLAVCRGVQWLVIEWATWPPLPHPSASWRGWAYHVTSEYTQPCTEIKGVSYAYFLSLPLALSLSLFLSPHYLKRLLCSLSLSSTTSTASVYISVGEGGGAHYVGGAMQLFQGFAWASPTVGSPNNLDLAPDPIEFATLIWQVISISHVADSTGFMAFTNFLVLAN